MPRLLSTLVVFCALLLQGSGGALAAVVCPHAGAPAAATKPDEHACCAARLSGDAKSSESKPDDSAAHCPMSNTRAGADEHPTADAAHATKATGAGAALLASPPCTHCVGSPDRPPAPNRTREPHEVRRDAPAPAPRAHAPRPAPVLCASAVEPSQHAPPAPGARRHILLAVFLI